MRIVGTRAGKAVAFRGFRNGVVQRYRVAAGTRADGLGAGIESILHGEDRPGESGRVGAIDLDRVEAVQAQVVFQPLHAALLL